MQDLYKNWPLAILGVETGSGLDVARRTMADEHLTYRVWWDPPGDDGVGPIATAWNVQGFPSIYVLDGAGVVRFVDLHDEDLLKGVRQLLSEQVDLEARATSGSGSRRHQFKKSGGAGRLTFRLPLAHCWR